VKFNSQAGSPGSVKTKIDPCRKNNFPSLAGKLFFVQSVIIAAAIASIIIRITVMAFVTSGGMQCLGMAGPAAAAAMVHAAATFIGNSRV
jgi:hypothetical protein